MASTAVLLVLLAALVAAATARPEKRSTNEDDFLELERKVLKKCNKDIQAPQSAIDNLLEMENIDSSPEGKCLIKCAMMSFGVMLEDGHMDEEKTNIYIRHAYSKPETQAKVKEISDLCVHRVEKVEDNCEHAYNYITCALEETKKNNIPKIHEEKKQP